MAQIVGNEVSALGLGLMGFTWRQSPPPLEQSLQAMRAALNKGINVWNGGEFYGTPEYNSMTLLKAYFTKHPEDADKVTIVIKGGVNLETHQLDGSPEGTRRSLDNIINQLGGTKKLDVFAPARRDGKVPLETTLSVIQKEYIDTGKLGGVSLSEVRAETIEEAVKHAKIQAVEVELSLFSPDILKNGVAAACAKHNIPVLAYSPIGRGMLTGRFKDVSQVKELGIAASFPRFQGDAFEHNLKLVRQVEALAEKKGCTPAQLAINWARSQGNQPGTFAIIPIPGATTVARVEENSKIVELSEDELKQLDDLVNSFEVVGTRYPEHFPTET